MSAFYVAVAVVLLGSVVAGFRRLVLGPDAEDRLVSAQLLGTTAVGILLLLAEAFEAPVLRFVGLVFASLAAVTIVAYVRLGVGALEPPREEEIGK
jgi:multicomponent Na+:H+ antiporter subunit F